MNSLLGVGVDLVDVQRWHHLLQKHSFERMSKRLLSLAECAEANIAMQHGTSGQAKWWAKRWAAKEALAKACGWGVRAPLLLPKITLAHTASGQPVLQLDDEVQAWWHQQGWGAIHLSLSD